VNLGPEKGPPFFDPCTNGRKELTYLQAEKLLKDYSVYKEFIPDACGLKVISHHGHSRVSDFSIQDSNWQRIT